MDKVDFVICGTQKGGTSALDEYLRGHPEICMAKEKEVHFFDNENYFNSEKTDYSIYHSRFNPRTSHKIFGETTPIYMYWYDAPKRVWEYNPNIKLIVILRNPIDRAYSHWNMERLRNNDRLPFLDALKNERERCCKSLPFQHRVYSYIDRGYYLQQLRKLWSFFLEEQVLVLRNEELRYNPPKTLKKICNFLDIDSQPFLNIKPKNVHSRPYQAPMSKREKDFLRNLFEYEILNLERVFNWDCSEWLID